ncbi:Hypothetical predicted protein [Olea europaea subsp. europaea]|uniref:Uncharacterized protein n=1 Tax=Olea europaea subsp. europaea TaxID=158383 RepID=A0A8S0SYP6_OLEEU|nr:Hypothetical predicted protein [Olea europaea subsp. europaea]
MRCGLQEYMLVMGLRCGTFLEGAEFDRLLERRLKKSPRPRYFHCHVWAYEALLKVGEHFSQRHRTYDTFFKNVKLHVYATLHPTNVEGQQPYFFALVPYDDPPVPILDDIARTVVAPKGGFRRRGAQRRKRSSSDCDGEDTKDTDESYSDQSSAGEDTHRGDRGASSSPRPLQVSSPERRSTTQTRAVGTSAPCLTKEDVKELLLDQRILFEMRLRTVKLEIQQHVTSESATSAKTEVDVSAFLPEDEQDIPVDTGTLQDEAHIAPCQDDVNEPVVAASEELQNERQIDT